MNIESAALSKERFELADIFDREGVMLLEARGMAGAVAAIARLRTGTYGRWCSALACCATDAARLIR